MANLKFNEKQIFEKLFDRGGYVLDFSNRTFTEFFNDFHIDIDSSKYQIYGTSKMKRLRAFWDNENNKIVGEVLESLLEIANNIDAIDQKDYKLAKQYINRLLGKEATFKSEQKELTEDDFLNKEFEKIDITLLNLGSQVDIITQRIEEIKKCLSSNASLSVIFLCGSTLEGLLLNLATQNQKKFNTSKSAPKKDNKVKQFHEWSLNDFINVAHEQNFIGLDIKKFSHALRDFRNFIHPYQQMSLQFNPDQHTAKISWQVLQATIANLSGDRK